MTSTVILVSCCGEKLARPAPACELYRSQLFRLARAYAQASGAPWLILSALHGAIEPHQVIEPYDLRLPASRAARGPWGARAAGQLLDLVQRRPTTFVSLCGAPYTDTIEQLLAAAGSTVSHPLRGLGIGQRLAVLSKGWPA